MYIFVFIYRYLVKRKEALSDNFTFRYEDDILSLNNRSKLRTCKHLDVFFITYFHWWCNVISNTNYSNEQSNISSLWYIHSISSLEEKVWIQTFCNKIKDTTERDRSGSYLDVHLEIDNEGRLSTQLYDTRDDINFPIVNFQLMRSTIPAAHETDTSRSFCVLYLYTISWNSLELSKKCDLVYT
jgi:hypothetical protein